MKNKHWCRYSIGLILIVVYCEAYYYKNVDETTDSGNEVYILVSNHMFPDRENALEIRSKQRLNKLRISASTYNLKTDVGLTEIPLTKPKKIASFFIYNIGYLLPFALEPSSSLNLNVTYEYCPQSNEDEKYGERKNNYDEDDVGVCELPRKVSKLMHVYMPTKYVTIMGETHKPIYRPGDELRFRFIALNSQMLQGGSNAKMVWPSLKLDAQNYYNQKIVDIPLNEKKRRLSTPYFDEIYIRDPSGNRVQEWKNVKPREALNMSYTLPQNAKKGKWILIAKVMESIERLVVIVKHFTPQRFLAKLELPPKLAFSEDMLRFNVCTSYTNGTPIRGAFDVQICVCSKGKLKQQIIPGELFPGDICQIDNYRQTINRKCYRMTGILEGTAEGNRCSFNSASIKKHLKDARANPVWDDSIGVIIRIEEEGTGSSVFILEIVETENYRKPYIEMEVSQVYRQGLPILGKIVLHTNDSVLNASNQAILLTATDVYNPCGIRISEYPTIYRRVVYTDTYGIANFIIPPLNMTKKLDIEAKLITSEQIVNVSKHSDIYFQLPKVDPVQPHEKVQPSIKETIRLWKSGSSLSLEVSKTIFTCPGEMILEVLTNEPVDGKFIHLEYTSRGLINKLSTVLKRAEHGYDCVDQDSDYGHYTCNSGASVGAEGEITCLEGWEGENCLTPVCGSKGCGQGGLCVLPKQCICKEGWSGDECEVCSPRPGCKHGVCQQGGDCVCQPGYKGFLCERTQVRHEDVDTKLTPTRTPHVTPVSNKAAQKTHLIRRTIFKQIVHFEMGDTFGPVFRGVLYVYQPFMKNNFKYMEMVSDFVKLENLSICSSPFLANLKRNNFPGIHFDRHSIVPGGKLKLSLKMPVLNLTSETTQSELDNVCLIRFTDASLRIFENYAATTIDLPAYVNIFREYPGWYSNHRIDDTISAFKAVGITSTHIISSLEDIIPSTNCPAYSRIDLSDLWIPENSKRTISKAIYTHKTEHPRLQDHFPEVWLFDFVELFPDSTSSTNVYTSELTVPDTITSWDFNAVCFSSNQGVWMPSEKPLVTISLPFYVEFTTPVQAKRNEILHLPITIFMLPSENKTQPDCYEVTVTTSVDARDWLTVGVSEFFSCLCAGDPQVVFKLALKPQRIGQLNVTAEAIARLDSSMCDQEMKAEVSKEKKTKVMMISVGDAVRRAIRIVPEGIEAATTLGGMLCVDEDHTEISREMKLVLPEAVVSGSLRTYVSVSGNVLGKALSNLDRLVRLPTGCGEQNMVKVAPNVYVLKYLVSSQLFNTSLDLVQQTLRYINAGYANQLNYRHENGSFSTFGPKTGSPGSTMLTAYVFGVFGEAENVLNQLRSRNSKMHLSFDSYETIASAFHFLRAMQRTDGCFVERGQIYQSYMQRSGDRKAVQRQELLLTSYVLSALTNAPTMLKEVQDGNITIAMENAKICILNHLEDLGSATLTNSVLAKALFALSRVIDVKSEQYIKSLLEDVEKRASVESSLGDTLTWWTDGTGSKALDVEATAYVYLAMQALKPKANMMPIVRWLSKQQKEQGGFYSTQDTVLALQALSIAALKLKTTRFAADGLAKLSVKIASTDAAVAAVIDKSNADISQQFYLGYHKPQTETTVQLKLVSSKPACVAVHISSLYNTPADDTLTPESFFSLEVSISQGAESMPSCTQAMTTVCTALTEAGRTGTVDTGMIVMSFEIPSGWKVTEADLMNVATNPGLNRVELSGEGQYINAYFSAFSQVEVDILDGDASKLHRCVSLPLQQRIYVDSSQPSVVSVIDYSNPQIKSEKSFSFNSCKRYWIDDQPADGFQEATTVVPVTPDPTLTTLAPPKCPTCEKLEKHEIIQKLNQTLCENMGSFNLFKQNPTSQSDRTFSGIMYQILYKTTVASWRTNLSLADGCHCSFLADGSKTAVFSPSYSVFAGDAEIPLAGRHLVPVAGIKEAANEFIKMQALKKPEAEEKQRSWCSRSKGLNGFLRKLLAFEI